MAAGGADIPGLRIRFPRITEDSLVAIFQRIDCGSLFKTFRLISKKWKKLVDQVHPDGDVKFADNEATIIYLNDVDITQEYLLTWYFNHNTEINKNITERISGKFTYAYDIERHYFVGQDECINDKHKYSEFVRSLVWVYGVIRLTEESLDIILNGELDEWNFKRIYAHAGFSGDDRHNYHPTLLTGIPFHATRQIIKKYNIHTINLYKRYPYHRKELRELKQFYGWSKFASREEIISLTKPTPGEDMTFKMMLKFVYIYSNPNMTLDIIRQFPDMFNQPHLLWNITLKMIKDNPDIAWGPDALSRIKVTDENIDEILANPTVEIISMIPNCSLKHAWMIAKAWVASKGRGQCIKKIIIDMFLNTNQEIPDGLFEILPPDWNGSAKTLSWKIAKQTGMKYLGWSKHYTCHLDYN